MSKRRKKTSKENAKKDSRNIRPGYKLIFRRFKTLPSGKVLDAYWYGLRAWPMWVKE